MIKSILGAMALLCASAAVARAAPPLSAYGKLPAVEDMVLSPDGKVFAFVSVDGDKRRVFARGVDGAIRQTVSLGEMKTRDLKWAGNDHLLIFVSTTLHHRAPDGLKYEMMSALSLNMNTGKTQELLAKRSDVLGNIMGYYGSTHADGRHFGYFRSQHFRGVSLFKVDLDDGTASEISFVDRQTNNWVLDDQGRIVARSAFDAGNNTWSLYSGPTGDHVAFRRSTKISDLETVGLGRTADTVLVEDQTGDEDSVLEVPLTGAAKPQLLFQNLKAGKEYFAPDNRLLMGAVDMRGGDAVFFNPLLQHRFEAARKPFAKYQVSLTSYDAAFDRLILFTAGADDAGTYWLVDLTSGKASELAEAYPDIRPIDVGPTKLIQYKASDGLEVEGVLTLPPGRKAERLPLIMLPHGGPIGVADRVGFDWWAQAFASKGYAVLQPNYRGSGDYGGAFRRAGYGEWGRKMQSDLSDGVAALALQGTIDPQRVCIVGGSYGGYAALAGVTLQHGVYRCAVSYGGVSDLGTMMYRAGHNEPYSLASRWEQRAMGATWSGDSSLGERSPLHQAPKADAPILLIHGKDDTVVPISESENMDGALRRAGKPTSFVRLEGEDHWLSTPRARLQMLQAAIDFVVAHNPPV